jgi:arylsulfatase A-like enzyme
MLRTVPFLLAAAAAAQLAAGDAPRPDVIVVLLDDVSEDALRLYGGAAAMPNLERMAAEGLHVRTAWACPLCGPTRMALFTGLYAPRTGAFTNSNPTVPLDAPRSRSFPRVLAKHGYRTGWFGKTHFMEDPAATGFRTSLTCRSWPGYDGPKQDADANEHSMYAASWYWHPGLVHDGKGVPTTAEDFGPELETDALVKFIGAGAEPYLAMWTTNLPHLERIPGGKGWRRVDVPRIDANGRRVPGAREPGTLVSNLAYVDHCLGRIRAAVEAAGRAERTVIIVLGDNGTAGPEARDKNRTEDQRAVQVPFVVWAPGFAKGARGEQTHLIDVSDIAPTCLELAGTPAKSREGLDGHSFAPLITGAAYTPREHILSFCYDRVWIRDARWLLDGRGRLLDTSRPGSGDEPFAAAGDDAEAGAARARFRAIEQALPIDRSSAAWKSSVKTSPYPPREKAGATP